MNAPQPLCTFLQQPPSPQLEVSNLTLQFGGIKALTDVGFTVHQDELFAIIGPNGAGKSSIFNCLSLLYRPQAGSIRFLGGELVGQAPLAAPRLGIARTFQNLGLFEAEDVEANLVLGRHTLMSTGFLAAAAWWGRSRREEIEHRERVQELIDLLGLRAVAATPVGLLPYGTKKLVELGRALAMEPRLLLMDEPVAGMNRKEREHMAATIDRVRSTLRPSIVLVEHDIGFVMDLADRVMVLEFGKVICTGLPDAVRSDPRVIEAYLGQGAAAAPASTKGAVHA